MCPKCGKKLKVLKTRRRRVSTLPIGTFIAYEALYHCPKDNVIRRSEYLRSIVPDCSSFGFDIFVRIGKALFLESRSEAEIIRDMASRNIQISASEIAYLGKKFIAYLATAHSESQLELRRHMCKNGGYILHLDGTCDGNSPHLITGIDEISDIILHNIKIPTEKADHLIPFLEHVKQSYGIPLALVHDMGIGILTAIKGVFPGIADFICHYHFLRDIGKDLFEKEYRKLKSRLAQLRVRKLLQVKARVLLETKKISDNANIIENLSKSIEYGKIKTDHLHQFPWIVTYVLIRWALDTRFDLKGYGFPFDRHHFAFYQRLKVVHSALKKIMNIHISSSWKDNKPFFRIKRFLEEIIEDRTLKRVANQMEEKTQVFDKLRKAMRIAELSGSKGLNDDGEVEDIKTIEERVRGFRAWMVDEAGLSMKKEYAKMIEQIDRYWEKLFADPITVRTSNGLLSIQPQRTNNLLERFFRDFRRGFRRRTGMKSINKILKAILADTPLVKNLKNEKYLKIILRGKRTLEERFAEINTKIIRQRLKAEKADSEKLSPTLRKIVYRKDLPREITKLFVTHAVQPTSCSQLKLMNGLVKNQPQQ